MVTHSSPTVWHKQALLEIAHPRALLLAACLSRLLVNRIAPPNLFPQHLPACFVTELAGDDAQSEHDTEVFPAIFCKSTGRHAAETGCARKYWYLLACSRPESAAGAWLAPGLQAKRSGVKLWTHPSPCVTVLFQHIYCTSCCMNCGECAARRDQRHQENRSSTGSKVKYIHTSSPVKRKRSCCCSIWRLQ